MHEVVCQLSNEASDVRCSVCGQGFLVYWAKFSRAEQEQSRRMIQDVLRGHHGGEAAGVDPHAVHPREDFMVVERHAEPEYTEAAQAL